MTSILPSVAVLELTYRGSSTAPDPIFADSDIEVV